MNSFPKIAERRESQALARLARSERAVRGDLSGEGRQHFEDEVDLPCDATSLSKGWIRPL